MALVSVYERFLASPNPLSLYENASLHYVPTLTTFTQSGPIIRHLESQNKNVVKQKTHKTISAVEGSSSIALEIDTTMEFISGGGVYLPNLENFVVDKIVTLPITHIVQFGPDQKISQIRISWDQGSLLQQSDVIGARGRNWPITDGNEQIRLIRSSASNAPASTASTTSTAPTAAPTSPRGRGSEENRPAVRNASPSKRIIKDPYTSLDSYWTEQNEGSPAATSHPVIAPRAESFKPPPRDMSEIFAAGHEDNEPGSPKKSAAVPVVASKGAGNQKFGPARIFDDEESPEFVSPKIYKTNPARYNHFNIGEEVEDDPMQHGSRGQRQAKPAPLTARTNKHGSQWDFADFTTPAKPPGRERPDVKATSDWKDENKASESSPGRQGKVSKPRKDAESNFDFRDDGTPVERKVMPKARKDAETHFDFKDNPTPAPARIIARTDAAKGLYRNVLEETEQPLSDISNNPARRNDFGSHWQVDDDSPAHSKVNQSKTHNRNRTAQNEDASWSNFGESNEQDRRPTTSKAFKKGLQASWGPDADEVDQPIRTRNGAAQKGYWDF